MEQHPPPSPRRILLVDDDPISLQIIAFLLRSDHHTVTEAPSGEQAKAALIIAAGGPRPAAFDLVLADMQMPGMSGSELGLYVQTLPQPRPRMVAMSATRPGKVPPPGFHAFLLKPVDQADLRAAVAAPGVPARTATAAESTGTLDQQVLVKLKAIMPPEAIREIYTTYLTDTRMRIAELEGFAGRGDTEGVRRCAHMIKGSAAMAGVPPIIGIAAAFEAGAVPPENQRSLFHHLRIACDDVEQALAYTAPERLR